MSNIDVIFLDIAFNENINEGFEFACFIRKLNNNIPIIFLTNNSENASKGYLVEAVGFLSKPIDDKLLSLYLKRIYKRNSQKNILIENGQNIIHININELVYVESYKNNVSLHMSYGTINVRMTFSDLFNKIGKEDFIQIHKSYIISKQRILSIKKSYPHSVDIATTSSQITLSVGRKYISNLMIEYTKNIME